MRFDAYGVTGRQFPAPCQVFDATGACLSPVRECDTETGEVLRYEVAAGRFVIGPDGRPETIREMYPAPLVLRSAAFA